MGRLERLFAAVVPTLVAGCERGIDESQFTDDVCGEGEVHMLQAIEPESAIDAIEWRQASTWDVDENGDPVIESTDVVDADGELCSAASDRAACLAQVAAVPFISDLVEGSFEYTYYDSLVYTRDDEVGGLLDLDAVRELLGTIDAPGDAALLGTLSGHSLRCGDGDEVGPHGDGWVLFTTTGGGCGPGDDIEHHVVLVRADGSMKVIQTELIEKGDPGCAAGRIPAGLRGVRVRCGSPVGDYLAEIAQLEAASITAFEQLALELRLHGAPQRLIDAAILARADEVRHARVTAKLARRWGGRPRRPIVLAQAPRALLDVAIDNAIEGCIRETFGAASADLSARQASDRTLQRALAKIAVDETRHAALSWQLAAWLDTKLARTQRRTLARARRDAYERMEQELTADRDPAVHRVCGLPEPGQARALYRSIGAALLA